MIIANLVLGTISTVARIVNNECQVKYIMIESLSKQLDALEPDDYLGSFILGFKAGARAQIKINIFNYKAWLCLLESIEREA